MSDAPRAPGTTSSFSHKSRARLTRHVASHFPTDSLFDRIARVVCEAGCLPRKELYESWEVARRVRRRFRGGRVVDLACGHALVAHMMLLLDDSSPTAVAVDARLPDSAKKLHEALVRRWPRLAGRVTFRAEPLARVALCGSDVVVSAHACGALTDDVIARALEVRARVAVLPCCHDLSGADLGGLEGWVDGPFAIDIARAMRLRAAGYAVRTQRIAEAITPKNRLLLGEPATRV